MPPVNLFGPSQITGMPNEFVTEIVPVLREILTNEFPLWSRLARSQAPGETYNVETYDTKPRKYTLQTAIASAGATSIVLAGDCPLGVGDVLEISNNAGSATERVEVTADRSFSTNTTLTVRRAREGTSGITNDLSGNTTVYLIGNSRNGAEIDLNATRVGRTSTPNYIQTFQEAVQTGGKANAVSNVRIPSQFASLFETDKNVKSLEYLQNIETTVLYGIGEAPSAMGDRAKMIGIKSWINKYNSGANVRIAAGGSYTKFSLIADAFQKALDAGGNPNVALCSTNFMGFLAQWGFPLQQFQNPMVTSALGVPINAFLVPFLQMPVTLIPHLMMRPGTFCALTWEDLSLKFIREMFWLPRGVRGDVQEGDWLGDYGLEIKHPGWHAWVEGITSVA